MKKEICFSTKGFLDKVGTMDVYRLLPNSKIHAVGPFVFLDNIPRSIHAPKNPKKPDGSFAHPHRGIATFSYLLSGELEHFDSRGNHGIISDGGLQWMKAGNGIIHDENPTQAFQKTGGTAQGMQFWINLPSKIKQEEPEYKAVQDKDVPEVMLENEAGVLRVLIGTYQNKASLIKQYTQHFLYHIQLKEGKSFIFKTDPIIEYATFLATGVAIINNKNVDPGELLVFGKNGNSIHFENTSSATVDIIFFGGEPYKEPIIAQGPYVMNTQREITEANNDYWLGKYGTINYENEQNEQKRNSNWFNENH